MTLSVGPLAAFAGEAPGLPCDGLPRPAFPETGAPPIVHVWTPRDLGAGWQPPACISWKPADFHFIIGLAGRFPSDRARDALLTGFGAVSELVKVRYWSVTDKKWRDLFDSAVALETPDLKSRRADFTIAELTSGRDLYFAEKDNRSLRPVVYRMRVAMLEPDRFLVEIENITPVRLFLLTIFQPGALQSVFTLERHSPTEWDYYGLVRTGTAPALFAQSSESYVNRALGLFYHYTGVQRPE